MNATDRDDFVPLGKGGYSRSLLLPLFALRPDDQKIHDHKHQNEHHPHASERTLALAAGCLGGSSGDDGITVHVLLWL